MTVDDLAPVDEFHIRGRTATEELAEWAEVQPGHLLLDVGCDLGGTSRYLAATVGCDVVGLDLTEEYCQVAEMLSARVGLADRTTFRQGNALALAFHDIFAGNESELHFPVPWAAEASISHLMAVEKLEKLVARLGFARRRWEDKTDASAAFFKSVVKRVRSEGWAPVGLYLLMGDDAATKLFNLLRNLEENRVRVVQAVLTRAP